MPALNLCSSVCGGSVSRTPTCGCTADQKMRRGGDDPQADALLSRRGGTAVWPAACAGGVTAGYSSLDPRCRNALPAGHARLTYVLGSGVNGDSGLWWMSAAASGAWRCRSKAANPAARWPSCAPRSPAWRTAATQPGNCTGLADRTCGRCWPACAICTSCPTACCAYLPFAALRRPTLPGRDVQPEPGAVGQRAHQPVPDPLPASPPWPPSAGNLVSPAPPTARCPARDELAALDRCRRRVQPRWTGLHAAMKPAAGANWRQPWWCTQPLPC